MRNQEFGIAALLPNSRHPDRATLQRREWRDPPKQETGLIACTLRQEGAPRLGRRTASLGMIGYGAGSLRITEFPLDKLRLLS
jgi:hypothetical protein